MVKNKVALIQSYCNTPEKIQALQVTLNKLRELNIDTCLFSSVVLPEYIINQPTYFIFSEVNPVLYYPEKAFNFWLWHFYKANPGRKFYMNKMFSDYGWTVLNQTQIMSSFIKDLDYNWFYLINYDLDFDSTVVDNILNPTSTKLFKHKKHVTIFSGTLIFAVLQKPQLEIICQTFNKQDFIATNQIPEDYFLNKIGNEHLVDIQVHDTITVEGQQKEQQFNEMPNNDLFKLFIQNKKRLLVYIFDPTKDMEINIHVNDNNKAVNLKQGEHQFIHFNIKPEDVKSLTIEIFGQLTFNFSYLFTETAPVCWFNDTEEQFSSEPPHVLIEKDIFLNRLVQYN